MAVCETRTPANCSVAELDEFRKLATSAGKVSKHRLVELIGDARLLAFLRDGGHLIGVAGLKRPRATYRGSAGIHVKSSKTTANRQI